jgi:hypothetical protein
MEVQLLVALQIMAQAEVEALDKLEEMEVLQQEVTEEMDLYLQLLAHLLLTLVEVVVELMGLEVRLELVELAAAAMVD